MDPKRSPEGRHVSSSSSSPNRYHPFLIILGGIIPFLLQGCAAQSLSHLRADGHDHKHKHVHPGVAAQEPAGGTGKGAGSGASPLTAVSEVKRSVEFPPLLDLCAKGLHSGHSSKGRRLCCAASCGSCGEEERGCSKREGGPTQCCAKGILAAGRSCSRPADTGCILPGDSREPQQQPAAKTPKVESRSSIFSHNQRHKLHHGQLGQKSKKKKEDEKAANAAKAAPSSVPLVAKKIDCDHCSSGSPPRVRVVQYREQYGEANSFYHCFFGHLVPILKQIHDACPCDVVVVASVICGDNPQQKGAHATFGLGNFVSRIFANARQTGKNVAVLSPPGALQTMQAPIHAMGQRHGKYMAKNLSDLLPLIRREVYTGDWLLNNNDHPEQPLWPSPEAVVVAPRDAVRSFGLDLAVWTCAPGMRTGLMRSIQDAADQGRKLCGCKKTRPHKKVILVESRASPSTKLARYDRGKHSDRSIRNMNELLQELSGAFDEVSEELV
jgi:hypothetical protein